MEIGKWEMEMFENGKWEMGNGKWEHRSTEGVRVSHVFPRLEVWVMTFRVLGFVLLGFSGRGVWVCLPRGRSRRCCGE